MFSNPVVISGTTRTITSGQTVITGTASEMLAITDAANASGTFMQGSGTVLSGGTVSSLVIDGLSGSHVSAIATLSGGQSIAATIGSGGELSVAAGTAYSTTVTVGGFLQVLGSGTTSDTALAGTSGQGGTEVIVGGSANGTVVNSGTAQVLDAGSTSGTVVLSGAYQAGSFNTVALNDAVSSGGTVSTAGVVAFTEAAGAASSFGETLLGSGMLVQSGPGTLALDGALAGFGGMVLVSGGTLELTSAGAAGAAPIVFGTGVAGARRIDGLVAPSNGISGFSSGDVIDLAGLAYAGRTAPIVSGNVVTVAEGGFSEALRIAGAASGTFALAADGFGGRYWPPPRGRLS